MGCHQSKPEYASSTEVKALQHQIHALQDQIQKTKLESDPKPQPQPQPPPKKPQPKLAYKPVSPSEVPLSVGGTEVIFFPDAKLPCYNLSKPGGCRRPNCGFAHEPTNLTRYLDILGSASRTLDVCVFTITCDEICRVVISLKDAGVRVRVITDSMQANCQGSDIAKLRAAQIEVRQNAGSGLMHHKFVVVDGRTLLAGSFNMTRQAVLGNAENVVVQNNQVLVTAFAMEFEKLWQQYKDNKGSLVAK